MNKTILAAVIIIMTAVVANAQISVDVQAGYVSPQGDAFEYCVKGGLGYSVDVMYTPDILDNQLSFGIAKDGCVIFSASGSFKERGLKAHASKLGLVGAKARYSLSCDGPRPYGALTIGVAYIKSYYLYEQVEIGDGVSNKFYLDCMNDNKFCVKPEVGVAFGVFTVGIGWLIPCKFEAENTGYTLRASAFEFNIGLRFGEKK